MTEQDPLEDCLYDNDTADQNISTLAPVKCLPELSDVLATPQEFESVAEINEWIIIQDDLRPESEDLNNEKEFDNSGPSVQLQPSDGNITSKHAEVLRTNAKENVSIVGSTSIVANIPLNVVVNSHSVNAGGGGSGSGITAGQVHLTSQQQIPVQQLPVQLPINFLYNQNVYQYQLNQPHATSLIQNLPPLSINGPLQFSPNQPLQLSSSASTHSMLNTNGFYYVLPDSPKQVSPVSTSEVNSQCMNKSASSSPSFRKIAPRTSVTENRKIAISSSLPSAYQRNIPSTEIIGYKVVQQQSPCIQVPTIPTIAAAAMPYANGVIPQLGLITQSGCIAQLNSSFLPVLQHAVPFQHVGGGIPTLQTNQTTALYSLNPAPFSSSIMQPSAVLTVNQNNQIADVHNAQSVNGSTLVAARIIQDTHQKSEDGLSSSVALEAQSRETVRSENAKEVIETSYCLSKSDEMVTSSCQSNTSAELHQNNFEETNRVKADNNTRTSELLVKDTQMQQSEEIDSTNSLTVGIEDNADTTWNPEEKMCPPKIGRYNCSYCNRLFVSESKKYYHERSVHFQKDEYICGHCHCHFVSKELLRIHIQKHTNIMKYRCYYCDRRFTTNSRFSKHLKKHASSDNEQ